MCINFSGTLDSDPEAVVSVNGCKVGFCREQEMYSVDKKAKLSENKDEMYLSKNVLHKNGDGVY